MLYHVLHINTSFVEEWQKDLFDQELCDLGVDTIDGEDYYIPSALWEENENAIRAQLSNANFQYTISPVADENWNAVWEAEHPIQELPLGVKIIPHCAFGAGHHETTSLLINTLLSADLTGKNVLDHGTGTGVLAIFAKIQGAQYVLANDIDDKSVENAKENAALNNVEIDIRLGDLSSLPFREGLGLGFFHLILANIHRNVLLDHMPAYAASLQKGGELWLSGFYESDCPILQAAAEQQGLTLIDILSNGEWRLMRCRK